MRLENGVCRYGAPWDFCLDSWTDQKAIDAHHKTSMMQELAKLRDKYDLHMRIERYVTNEVPDKDKKFLRK